MKIFYFTLFLVLLFFNANSQGEKNADINKLIGIAEKSDFKGLCKLVSLLEYRVLDSSKEKSGSLFYFAKEFKFHGSSLACSRNNQSKITELSYMTFDEAVYKKNKQKLIELGFKSQGVHKDGLRGITESEDFEKVKLLLLLLFQKKIMKTLCMSLHL